MNGFLSINLMFSLIRAQTVYPSDTYEKRMSPINLVRKKPCDIWGKGVKGPGTNMKAGWWTILFSYFVICVLVNTLNPNEKL